MLNKMFWTRYNSFKGDKLMYQINYKEMGKRIRTRREELKLTQEKLSEKVGVGPTHFGQIERGENKCSLSVIVNIAIALDLNLDTLIRGIDEQNVDTALLEILDTIPKDDKKMFVRICDNVANTFR